MIASPYASDEALIRARTRLTRPPLNPEFQLYLAEQLEPIWSATERHVGDHTPPPYWAFAWPGSQVLARYLLDNPSVVAQKRVLDFASGCGLAAIAAVRAGAEHVLASDTDPLAISALQLNARLNAVEFESTEEDLVGRSLAELNVDLVMAGDVCYERTASARVSAWLGQLANDGAAVLLCDPGRAYAPPEDTLELLARYTVPTLRELESQDSVITTLWRVKKASAT